jgi:hypothetical protein
MPTAPVSVEAEHARDIGQERFLAIDLLNRIRDLVEDGLHDRMSACAMVCGPRASQLRRAG